ncbi:MAG: efflux transporter periplasmic adaptor subunit [Verrucomicrobia bacterium]|nr:MAG: efflux transporter periplasmic adaptor subunit [Verrucomicrobiota bacterium]
MKRFRSCLMNGRDPVVAGSRPFGLRHNAARPAVAPYLVTALAIGVSIAMGCSRKAAQAPANAPEVLVTTVTPQDVPRVLERVATLDGFIDANINAQVQGYIVSRDYQEGSVVKKGDLLFQIDPRPFQAALAQANGTLAKDKANQVKADADERRALDLFKRKVISDQERDTAIAAAGSSRANVEADQAAVEQAQLNLGYTKVTAPIDGLAGFANNQVGDLVGPTTGPLTTVSQIDPIKAVVTAGEGPFTDFVSRHPDATERNAYIKSLDFDLFLGNGELYPRKGKFYALDRSLDPKTGSIRYYVTFPNPGNILRPGQFGKVRFVADMKKGAMVIPQEAVNELQGNFQVAVVDENNKVSIRPVKMGERIGAMWEVTEGLKPGDKVVVQGLQKAREGATVIAKDWTPPADALVSKADQQKKP